MGPVARFAFCALAGLLASCAASPGGGTSSGGSARPSTGGVAGGSSAGSSNGGTAGAGTSSSGSGAGGTASGSGGRASTGASGSSSGHGSAGSGGGTAGTGTASGGVSGGGTGASWTSPVGVYVPTFGTPLVGRGSPDAGPGSLLGAPFVDGFFIARSWEDIEDAGAHTLDCSSIVADVDAVARAGKKATLAIGAGDNTPPWVCAPVSQGGAGAACVTLAYVPHVTSGNTPCNYTIFPVPWDPAYEAAFGGMIQDLAACLAKDANVAATLVEVKVTGINERNEEGVLPHDPGGTVTCTSGSACVGGTCDESDDLAVFVDAGFTATSASQAYEAFAQDIRSAFPGVVVGANVSPLMLTPPDVPDAGFGTFSLVLTEDFVADAALPPISAMEQGLSAGNGAKDPGPEYARAHGVPVGLQMVASVVDDPTCEMAGGLPKSSGCTCPDECVLTDAIDNGIQNGGARWLEIYWQDLLAFPDAGWYAHDLLTDGG
jgi:hypothetical protein